MKVNKTNIAAVLRESVFTPKNDGHMKVIAEVGNYDYYVRRAVESAMESLYGEDYTIRNNGLTLAISLLALAKLTDTPEPEPEPVKAARIVASARVSVQDEEVPISVRGDGDFGGHVIRRPVTHAPGQYEE